MPSRGLGRWPQRTVVALALLSVGAAGAWATLTVLRPADDPLAVTEHTYVEVSPGSVGTSISLRTHRRAATNSNSSWVSGNKADCSTNYTFSVLWQGNSAQMNKQMQQTGTSGGSISGYLKNI